MAKDLKAEKPEKTIQQTVRAAGRKPELFPVENLAGKQGVPGWETAALMRAAGWAAGKQVSESDFQTALNRFRSRPQGGGRI